eukprot:85140-Chlamydomonas_euryale.AAC.1
MLQRWCKTSGDQQAQAIAQALCGQGDGHVHGQPHRMMSLPESSCVSMLTHREIDHCRRLVRRWHTTSLANARGCAQSQSYRERTQEGWYSGDQSGGEGRYAATRHAHVSDATVWTPCERCYRVDAMPPRKQRSIVLSGMYPLAFRG